MNKIKVMPFNDLSFEERQKISYYYEKGRIQAINQILDKLKSDIGTNQKRKITDFISRIEKNLNNEYEVIKK